MKRLRTSMIWGILLLLAAAGCFPGAAYEYLVGAGDVLKISVWGHPELTTEVVVRPDGYLTFPLVGDHWALDKTSRELSGELQRILADFVVNPQVTVIVSQFRTLQVQVLGEVGSAGYYQLRTGARLLDVLASAGGPSGIADLSRVSVTRYGRDLAGMEQAQVIQVDVERFISTGNLENNPPLESGDLIYVPASGRATIFGEVRHPTSYDLGAGLDILELLALAGGALDSADLERVVLTAQTEQAPLERSLDVQAMLSGRSKALEIRPNDIVFVPKKQQVMVLGAVEKPGVYDLHKETHLIDILARAGGVLASGDASSISITRGPHADQEIIVADASPGLSGKAGGDNPRLAADDLIFVPEDYRDALVLGKVKTPGSYLVREKSRVLDLLAEAGGALEGAGDVLLLTRDGQVKEINLGALERLGLQNERILPGDVLYLPEGRRQVLVLGEVRNPGYFQFQGGDRLLDAIGLAGGLTGEALQEQVSLSRQTEQGSEIILIDFVQLMEDRYLAQNVPLQGGDVIIVPRSDRGVIVLGEVRSPGHYRFQADQGLLDAVMLAGGFTESAQEDQVSLSRQTDEGTEVTIIDFGRLLEKRYLEEDLALRDGDVIIVPRSDRGVIVLGEVRSPGYYKFQADQGLLDAVMLAGGFTESAQEDQVSLSRQTDGGTEVTIIDFGRLLERRYLEEDLALRDGDVIIVPKSDRSVLVLGEVRSPGYYVFGKGQNVMDAVASAGGFTENAEPGKVAVTRQTEDGVSSEILNLDLTRMAPENPPLQGGEIIAVPKLNRTVLVFGGVNRAGAYNLPPQGTLLDVLALAGGLDSNLGTEQIVVTRQMGDLEEVWEVAYQELMTGQSAYNLALFGGDVVYVPALKKQILVLGQVRSPGAYNLSAGARVMDAIALAGGPLERAALQNVGIYRDGSVHDSELVTMGKDKVLFTGEASENPLLSGGDIIYVPETEKPDWTKIFSFLGGLKTFRDLLRL